MAAMITGSAGGGCACGTELAKLRREVAELREQIAWVTERLQSESRSIGAASSGAPPTTVRTGGDQLARERVLLFRSLFVGRDDVFASRWERDGKKGWSPKYDRQPGQSWAEAKDAKQYLPLTDEVIHDHLAGKITAGLYPMLSDDSCQLLACDFDGAEWRLDAQAYAQAATSIGVPVAMEISRSGDGAHVWMFFTEPVPALDARALGFAVLREAMALRGELGVESYDRFFPTQDYLPSKGEGLGNLIALPLQKQCRSQNTTVFVDPETFAVLDDQWAFLAQLKRLTLGDVQRLVSELPPVAVGPDAQLFRSSLRAESAPPKRIHAEWHGMLAVRRSGIPASLLASLKHASSLANPEFYKNENLRISNWKTPRFVRCYQEDLEFLYLPRAMADRARSLISEAGSELAITDRRVQPESIEVTFTGVLRDVQQTAVAELVNHELGVLEAPPGAGKTVMGCALIAHHRVPTLVLVDRTPLMDQWRERIAAMLDVGSEQVGQIGGGRNKPTGVIDLAMMQTLARMDDAAERLAGYGLVIVDEAHHAGAPTIEKALRRIPARRWVGLTATAYRRDGLGPIIFMHCGPKRHVIPMVDASDPEPMARTVSVHHTEFVLPEDADTTKPGAITSTVFNGLIADDDRNEQVCHDVHAAVQRGRNCLVLTRQTKHVDTLAEQLREHGHQPYTLYATKKAKELKALLTLLANPPADGPPLLVIATDRYVGEGYDCPRLDTLFLAHPVSFKGSMVQYVGRILRTYPGKASVEVHDYVDSEVGVLAAMWRKRARSYGQLGFRVDISS
ncbi:helicase [Pseudonocardiaceae bacterium YIM PH 21723]|nr:helicase [Pseudonocardiaceae bacterium YIM PH 21723]